ncbi:response regulator [uncultured Lacinutrix sp.]|uniref:response regulator n=1 Tax=uncultured Lacinutrix sp. TaxID=574032 RepID=UPI0026186541|nr:response regulator [uncultured Lacinutrix sp.]
MKSDVDVVVIHDDIKEHSLIITNLKELYNNVKLIDDPEEGLNFVINHLTRKTIVILDIDFGNGLNGYDVLEKIREHSFLVEVIILSAQDLPGTSLLDKIHQLFGLEAFDYIVRGKVGYDDLLIESVNRAKNKIKNNIASAIDEWVIENNEDKDKPIYFSSEGEAFSLNDISNEVRNQTEIGKDFAEKLNSLTIDLLLRGKEKL